ncbi:MAG: preprotein translocase subunit YajC [Chitinispirillaceae bacterium]
MQIRNLLPAISLIIINAMPLLAQEQPEPAQPSPFGGNFIFIMIAMFVIIYFLMIRPEQKKQKERQKMLSALKKGDKVLTIGGIMGVIQNVKDSTYSIKIGENTVVEVTKSAVSSVLTAEGNEKQADKDKEKK